MRDILPYPDIRGRTDEEKIKEIVNYLVQLKETLEFELTDIGTENLSPELKKMLSLFGLSAQGEEEIAQITGRILTISDVIESPMFTEAVQKIISENK